MTDYLLKPLLDSAINIGLIQNAEIHKKWIEVQHKFAAVSGRASLIAFAPKTRLDLLLRQLEAETWRTMQTGTGGGLAQNGFVDDFALSLAEMWWMRSYELVRAARDFCEANAIDFPQTLQALLHNLALVRMPIDKGEMEGTNRKVNKAKLGTLEFVFEQSDAEFNYATGDYILPRAICGQTGATMWYPIDIETGAVVEICRRDLSDALLKAFD